jgi:acetyl-CoA C-acetyltransferase
MTKRKLGRGVALVGAGMSRFGHFPQESARDLFVEAFRDMRDSVDRGFDPKAIDAMYIGNFSNELFENQGHLAPILANWIGLTGRPAVRVEDACASGSVALRLGIQAIASGMHDMVLVSGVEKMSGHQPEQVNAILSTTADHFYEVQSGFTFASLYAVMANAYLHQFSASAEMLTEVALKNRDNGALNNKAFNRTSVCEDMDSFCSRTIQQGKPRPCWADEYDFLNDAQSNPYIASPLRLYDCAASADGAAAVLLVAEEVAASYSLTPIYVIGSGMASDGPLYSRPNLVSFSSTREAARQAIDMAAIQPGDLKMAEVHDCFTIAEVIASEDLGLFEPGFGAFAVMDRITTREGRLPLNPSGGLLGRGHAVGATGVAQAVEVWKQMRFEADGRQIQRDIDLAMTHNIGGTGQTCAVHIFERR